MLKFENEYSAIPDSTQHALQLYVQHKIPTGGFLNAVLSNNLMESFSRADSSNMVAMHLIVKFIYNKMPIGCHGSPEIVKNWLEG